MNALLFYNATQSVAATGRIDEIGHHTIQHRFQSGFFATGWTHIVVTRTHLLYYKGDTGQAATGQIDDAGNHAILQSYQEDSLPAGWTHIVVSGNRLLFYNTWNGAGATGKIDEAGNYTALQGYPAESFTPGWTHIAAIGNRLLFYKDNNGQAATGQIDTAGNHFTLQSYAAHTLPTGWTHIVSSGNRLLFYNSLNGAGATGKIDEAGNYTTLRSYPAESFSPGWTHIATVSNHQLFLAAATNHLLYYNTNTGQAATGQIDEAGNHITLRSYPAGSSTIGWTHINSSGPAVADRQVQPLHVRLVLDELTAGWTTDRNVFNTRDETYFVVTGASGSKEAQQKIVVPRVSPPPPEDYFQFHTGTTRHHLSLIDLTLNPGDTALVNIVLREQDNAQLEAISLAAQAAAAGLAAFITGSPEAAEIAKERAKSALKEFYASLSRDGDQNLASLGVQLSNTDGRLQADWYGGNSTFISGQQGFSATFEAEDSDARYTGRASARLLQWSTWKPFLKTGFSGRPALVSRDLNVLDIFVRGNDNRLWQRHWNRGHWSEWMRHDGLELSSSPVADTMGAEHLHVFARGADGQLWQKAWLATGWQDWVPLGGSLIGPPAVRSRTSEICDVFIRGTDNRLWQRSWDHDHWTEWGRHEDGFVLGSSPVADSLGPEHVHLFALGADAQLWQKAWLATGWQDWAPLGGAFASDPAVRSRDPSVCDVFVRSSDNRLWHRVCVSGSWKDWEVVRDAVVLASPTTHCMGPNHLQVLAQGADGQISFKEWGSSGQL